MENIGVIIGVACGLLTIIGAYTGLIYKIATLTSTINQNTAILLELRNIVVDQDKEIEDVKSRVTILETTCRINHKEE